MQKIFPQYSSNYGFKCHHAKGLTLAPIKAPDHTITVDVCALTPSMGLIINMEY
jgi:hypothetical protein